MHARVVYIGVGKGVLLERCLQFRGVLIERFHCIMLTQCYMHGCVALIDCLCNVLTFV